MKRLTFELAFEDGRPVWESIRILDYKEFRRSLKKAEATREVAKKKSAKARAKRGRVPEFPNARTEKA